MDTWNDINLTEAFIYFFVFNSPTLINTIYSHCILSTPTSLEFRVDTFEEMMQAQQKREKHLKNLQFNDMFRLFVCLFICLFFLSCLFKN